MDTMRTYKDLDAQIEALRKEVCPRYTRRLKIELAIDRFYAVPDLDKEQAMKRLDFLEGKKRNIDVFWVAAITSLAMSVVWYVIEKVLDIVEISPGLMITVLAAVTIAVLMGIPMVSFGMTNDFLWIHSYERDYELKVLRKYLRKCMNKDKGIEQEIESEDA